MFASIYHTTGSVMASNSGTLSLIIPARRLEHDWTGLAGIFHSWSHGKQLKYRGGFGGFSHDLTML